MAHQSVPITDLPNIGPVTARWLHEIGVHTADDLRALGAIEAYRRISLAGNPTTRNLLYALHGAITNTPWNQLDPATREQLQREAL